MMSAPLTAFPSDGAQPGGADASARATDRRARVDYHVVEASLPREAPDVLRLWLDCLENFTPESASAKLLAGYVDNPAGPGLVLLLRTGADGETVGVQGLFPRRLHLGSASWRAASISDFAVAQSHRSLGPALMLVRAIAEVARERFELTYGLPNASATAVCTRGGLRRVGMIRRHVKVLRWQHLLARHMPTWMAIVLCVLTHPLRMLHSRLRQLAARPRLHCREADWTDPAIEMIWSRRPADLLLSERTAAMLAWRFGRDVRDGWKLSIAADGAGQPCGYVVWRLQSSVIEIGDVFASDPAHQLAAVLLSFFPEAAKTGASSVSMEFAAPPALVERLRRAGMRVRDEPSPVFEVPQREGKGPAQAGDVRPWYLTRFDNDAD